MGSLTLALVEVLLSVGVPAQRARAIVDAIDASISERVSLQSSQHASRVELDEVRREGQTGLSQVRVELAGLRADLAGVRTELRTEIAEVRTEIAEVRTEIAELRTEVRSEIAAVRVEIAQLRTEIAGVKLDLTRWMLGAMTAQAALLLGAMKLMQSI